MGGDVSEQTTDSQCSCSVSNQNEGKLRNQEEVVQEKEGFGGEERNKQVNEGQLKIKKSTKKKKGSVAIINLNTRDGEIKGTEETEGIVAKKKKSIKKNKESVETIRFPDGDAKRIRISETEEV